MKSSRMLGLLFLFLIVLPFNVYAALNVDIEVKPTFVKGDVLSFNYEIISTEDIDIGYTPYVDCPKASKPLLDYRIASLQKNIPFTGAYDYIQVTGDIEPQTCVAYIQLISPFEQKFEKTFTIETPPSIVFRMLTCKDVSCESQSKVFAKNEDIYFSYISDIPGIKTEASLIYPNEKIKQITLPTSIKAEQIGTYELEIIASKEGYKTITTKEQFAVIKKEAEIKFVGVCNANGICEDKENYQNCPQDCLPKKGINKLWIILPIIIISILIIIVVVVRRKRKSTL